MTVLWIGVVVYLGLIVPVVLVVLGRTVRAARAAGRAVDDLAEHAARVAGHLEALGAVERLPEPLGDVAAGLERYGTALERRR